MNQAIIFYKDGEETKLVLGYYDEDRIENIPEYRNYDGIKKYQLQYDITEQGIPLNVTMHKEEVTERYYGDFVTDTNIETLDKVEFVELCGDMIHDLGICNFDPENEALYLYEKLDTIRKEILNNKIVEALSEPDPKGYNITNVSINNDGSISLNLLENEYLIEIHNMKDLI